MNYVKILAGVLITALLFGCAGINEDKAEELANEKAMGVVQEYNDQVTEGKYFEFENYEVQRTTGEDEWQFDYRYDFTKDSDFLIYSGHPAWFFIIVNKNTGEVSVEYGE